MRYVYLLICCFVILGCNQTIESQKPITESTVDTLKTQSKKPSNVYAEQIEWVKSYALQHHYDTNYCILVDFSKHSGKYRFFVANIKQNKTIDTLQALVAHGQGCGQSNGIPSDFSNVSGSNCSSLGLSEIAERSGSKWGVKFKYWLNGLEKSNNNMRNRVVVLHSWEHIPNQEVAPHSIAQSEGCFTVSNEYMLKLDLFLKQYMTQQKFLIYAFN